ncbi:antibiotic biosynthesis monooxygenase family protein [Aromatoleum diolicum]|uniref:ABM domain-containing protein n=1 Tax=Aromatoleum diolicum TaxID=75796 RepID=A0ABX1QB01_9RHOO|nr:hypothetical protein [Aromatoleum diolicum]NMG74201.1 hypothetical protein [Aromatoleum diolicum]
MYVTVFRAKGSADHSMQMQYSEWFNRLAPLLPDLDGFISMKQYLADDGEACFIVEFRDEVSHRAWSEHPLHLAAKEFGRSFFSSYDIKVCELRYQRSSG